jgi:uncharacterized protein YbjT (DUF2867 family)
VVGAHLIGFSGSDYTPLDATASGIVELAAEAGVRRASLLQGVQGDAMAQALRASELHWAEVRPVEFMANTLDWAEAARTIGEIREPFPAALSAMVHEADIGAVAAAVLTGDGHHGQSYLLTGPQALTKSDKVRILSEAVGRELRYVELTEEQARERWAAQGYDAETIEFFAWVHGSPPEEGLATVAESISESLSFSSVILIV